MDKPITRSKLLIIDPVILALTTSIKPAFRATKAIINSVALPKVAFKNPPIPGPTTTAISSVAVPIQAARGRIAKAAVMKTIKSPHSKKWAARDMGINSSSTVKIMFLIDIFTFS
jgi:hypothetical protein